MEKEEKESINVTVGRFFADQQNKGIDPVVLICAILKIIGINIAESNIDRQNMLDLVQGEISQTIINEYDLYIKFNKERKKTLN